MAADVSIQKELRRCRVITTIMMCSGFSTALLIYLRSEEALPDPLAEFIHSKKFAYELERMGGKAALAANDLNGWFAGLWRGQNLAFTVAAVTLIIAAGYYVIASGLIHEIHERHEEQQ